MTDYPAPPPGQVPPGQGPPEQPFGAPPPPAEHVYGQPVPPPQQQHQQYGYGYGYGSGHAEYAGFWARFGASLLDGLIVGLPIALVTYAMAPGLSFLIRILVAMAYTGALDGGPTGQTIGRKALNIRVVDAVTGQPGIGFGRAVGRYFGRFVSGIALGLGYLWMLWDPRKQTWHDKFVNTIVVKA